MVDVLPVAVTVQFGKTPSKPAAVSATLVLSSAWR